MRNFLLLLFAVLLATSVLAQGVYHEASCPSVDPQRMIRMKRTVAEASGLLPAPDCHPEVRVRYLGVVEGGAISVTDAQRVTVRPYTRADGTQVRGYTRSPPKRD